MLFFIEHNKVLLRIPKNASTTITKYFTDNRYRNKYINADFRYFFYPEKVLSFRKEEEGHIHANLDTFKKYYGDYKITAHKFCIVRNPYGRVLSEYNYYKVLYKMPNLSIDTFIDNQIFHYDHVDFWKEGQYQYYKDCDIFYKIEEGLDKVFKRENIKFNSTEKLNSTHKETILSSLQKEKIYSLFEREFRDLNYAF